MTPPLWKRAALFKDSASILGARVVIPVAFFALSIAVARILGPEGLGHYALVMSLYAIFSLLSSMGLENLLLRDVAREPAKAGNYVSHALVLGLASSLACALLMTVTAHVLGYDPEIRRHLLWMTLVLLPGFINIVAELLFIALHRASFAFALALLREGSMVALSLYWLLQGEGLRGVIWALITSRVIGCLLTFVLFGKLGIRVSARLQPTFFKHLVTLIPSFLLINLLSNILLEVDIIILSRLAPAPDVGIYMVAKKLVRSSFLVIFSVITALFPDISQAFQRSDPRFGELFKSLWHRVLWGSVGLATLVTLLAHWGVHLAYGPQYAPAVRLMHTLAWVLVPLSLSFLMSRFLIIGDQQSKDLAALLVAVLVLIVTGITATLGWGVYGMVLANLTAISLLACLHYVMARRFLFKPYAARLRHLAESASPPASQSPQATEAAPK